MFGNSKEARIAIEEKRHTEFSALFYVEVFELILRPSSVTLETKRILSANTLSISFQVGASC